LNLARQKNARNAGRSIPCADARTEQGFEEVDLYGVEE
jgi:hypothetical protein